jgi:hypothetical protein
MIASGYAVIIKSWVNLINAPEYKRMTIACQPEGTNEIGGVWAEFAK